MRILTSFGCKVNGDSFFVSFETMGDVPKDQADATADELFAKARAAVERQQVKPEVRPESAKTKTDNGIAQAKKVSMAKLVNDIVADAIKDIHVETQVINREAPETVFVVTGEGSSLDS